MGIRAATVCVAWSRTEWRAYSPRSRLGLPGKRPDRVGREDRAAPPPLPPRSPERERWESGWRPCAWRGALRIGNRIPRARAWGFLPGGSPAYFRRRATATSTAPTATRLSVAGSGTTANCSTWPLVTVPPAKFALATLTVDTSTLSKLGQKVVSSR